ncbi:hypothetical protein ACAN107058_21100 [Paracidovorax anthurii]
MAAAVDGGRRKAAPTGLLARVPGHRPSRAAVADRPAAPRRWPLPRGPACLGPRGHAGRGPACRGPGTRRFALHGVARRLPGAAAPLERAGRHSRGRARGQPGPGGNRRPGRPLREYPGTAPAVAWAHALGRGAGGRARCRAGRPGPPGSAVRPARGGAAAGAEPVGPAALPGHVQPSAAGPPRARRLAGAASRALGAWRADGPVRADAERHRGWRRPAAAGIPLRERPVRRADRGAHGGPLRGRAARTGA